MCSHSHHKADALHMCMAAGSHACRNAARTKLARCVRRCGGSNEPVAFSHNLDGSDYFLKCFNRSIMKSRMISCIACGVRCCRLRRVDKVGLAGVRLCELWRLRLRFGIISAGWVCLSLRNCKVCREAGYLRARNSLLISQRRVAVALRAPPIIFSWPGLPCG